MNVAHTIAARRAGSYGFDAPYAPAGMVLGGLAYLAGAISWGRQAPLLLGPIWLGLGALVSFAMAGSYIYTTRRGKFVVWSRLIAGLGLRGDECVLEWVAGAGWFCWRSRAVSRRAAPSGSTCGGRETSPATGGRRRWTMPSPSRSRTGWIYTPRI